MDWYTKNRLAEYTRDAWGSLEHVESETQGVPGAEHAHLLVGHAIALLAGAVAIIEALDTEED